MKRLNKRFAAALAALLVLTCLWLTGCKEKETTLESILPRANVIKVSVSYLNVGVGDNVPQLSYEAVSSECAQLCDLLYSAAPVMIEIPEEQGYSPELNASHEIYLTTSGGTMTLYYDDYQNLINVPINRKVDERNVRVYLSYQAEGLDELVGQMQNGLPAQTPPPAQTPVETPAPTPEVALPDDSALRATIDSALLAQVGTEIAFEPANYEGQSANAMYYAYGHHEKPELPQNKVLLVAAPADGEMRQAAIAAVTKNDAYVVVRIVFAEGTEAADAAALVERADIDVGKPVVFVDDAGNILYAQAMDIPGEIPEILEPVTSEEPTEPSGAAGGEEGGDEPLEA